MGTAVADGLADGSVKGTGSEVTGNHSTSGLPLRRWKLFTLTTGTISVYVNDMI